MIPKNEIAQILRAFATTIDSLEKEEVDLLLSGKGKLTFTPSEKQQIRQLEESVDHEVLMDQLNHCKDRDEARLILSEIANKEILTSFAKTHKIYVAKHYKREDIENKIIEFVIGAKLRTEAIQTLNLKSGGNQTG